jgi:thiamine biosynthesis lipoprotein
MSLGHPSLPRVLTKPLKTLPAKPTKPEHQSLAFEAIGTQWHITFYTQLSKPTFDKLRTAIDARIDRFDITYSRFRPDSLVWNIAQAAGSYTFPEDANTMFVLYHELYDLTDGKFTPLIGQVLSDAGYDVDYSFRPKKLHRPPPWEKILSFSDDTLNVDRPALLDFGAGGKGYLVDIITELISSYGATEFSVNAGGDMYYHLIGSPPADVGLEHPRHPDEVIGIAHIKNQSICGSASNRRQWAGFHHTIDPLTLQSPKEPQAVWVVADSALVADALTTALCFTHAAKLKRHYTFEYAMVHSDNSLSYSPDFPATFF